MRKSLLAVGIATLLGVAGCQTQIPQEEVTSKIMADADTAKSAALTPPTYIRVYNDGSEANALPVKANELSLRKIIELALPNVVPVPMDATADLSKPLVVDTGRIPAAEFLRSLGNISGYDLTLNGTSVEVRSVMSKEWVVPMLADDFQSESKVQGQTGGTTDSGNNSSSGSSTGGTNSPTATGSSSSSGGTDDRGIKMDFKSDLDEWKLVVSTAESIMGVVRSGGKPGLQGTDSAGAQINTATSGGSVSGPGQVWAMRSQGLIRAYGPVDRLRRLDAWMTSMSTLATKQVRLDVTVVDVQLNDEKSRGVNWQGLLDNVYSKGALNVALGAGFPIPVSTTSTGVGSLSAGYTHESDSISSALQFLGQFGNLKVHNEPQVTTPNGHPAYISNGSEFGYVSSIQQTVSNTAVAITPTVDRLLVGLQVSITPHVLPDGRVYVQVIPVVSSFQGFDTFTIQSNTISQPRISLQQFASTGITASGVPLPLGGLISSTVKSTTNGLPIVGLGSDNPVDLATSAKDASLQRDELVFLVTPTLVD